MSIAGCPAEPVTVRELAETEPGFIAAAVAPIAAAFVVVAEFGHGLGGGYASHVIAGSEERPL
ncbi:hypothetical protein [Streptomyces jumonjinensis]|uniref:hypothetical protein n=1 Tax=Streptomyces jumonjinensis TaxID=1945 RepID=UPI0037A2A7F8